MNFTTESLHKLDSKLDTLHDRILVAAIKLAKKQRRRLVDNTIMQQAYTQVMKGK